MLWYGKEEDVDIEYVHASKFGNGAMVAREFQRQMSDRGVDVAVHHVSEIEPNELASADLYLFSSPGRMGRPIRSMRRFLKAVELPPHTRYAILTTEIVPKPDKKTGRMPTEQEIGRYQRVRPIMNEILRGKGLELVAEDKVYVTGLRGPLEDGWRAKVASFAVRVAEAGRPAAASS